MSNEGCLILFSGEICSGKSMVAKVLVKRFGFVSVSTGRHLLEQAKKEGLSLDRRTLQELGDRLDDATGGYWLVELAESYLNTGNGQPKLLLDSVRKNFQSTIFRETYSGRLIHVHLTAPIRVLRMRFDARRRTGHDYDQFISYEQAKESPTEARVRLLALLADRTFDTSRARAEEIAGEIVEALSVGSG